MDVTRRLLTAVKEGNFKKTQKILNHNDLSNVTAWWHGCVLLRSALESYHRDIAKLLLENGANVNSKNSKRTCTPLHLAVRIGDIDIVEMLLDRHAKVNARNVDRATPMHIAAELGHLAIVKLLLEHGACIDSKYITAANQYTTLHLSVKHGHEEVTALLLERGAPVNAKTIKGETALYIASEKGFSQIVRILLNYDANINDSVNNGYTPLHISLENDNVNIAKLLLNTNANTNQTTADGMSPLHIAVKKRIEEIIKLLLIRGAKSNVRDSNKGQTVLCYAIEIVHPEIVEIILKYSTDVDIQSNKKHFIKSILGNGKKYERIVESFLKRGFSIGPENIKNHTLFHAAIEKGHLKVVEDFLKLGADINMKFIFISDANMPLQNAVKYKHKELVTLLLKRGADVNAKDDTGSPAILYAIKNGDVELTKILLSNRASMDPELLIRAVERGSKNLVEILLEQGANINASDTSGRTALHFTVLDSNEELCEFNNMASKTEFTLYNAIVKTEIADLLLQKGIDVNAKTNNGYTTLHIATLKGYSEVVRMLLEHNVYVNSTTGLGKTALYFSVQQGNELICKMLLERGANVNAHLNSGSFPTPLHVATEAGHKKVVKCLLQFGADVDALDRNGKSALHIACKKDHLDIVHILLGYGCDINIVDKQNHTAMNYIRKNMSQNSNGVHNLTSVLAQHIVKLMTIKLYVKERIISSNIKQINQENVQILCEQELEYLKTDKIGNSRVSFHDVLTMDDHELAVLVGNEDIVKILESDEYEDKYLLYANIIRGRLRRAIMRRNLMKQGHTCLEYFFKNCSQVPFNCIEMILKWLSNDDIKNLISADLCELNGFS